MNSKERRKAERASKYGTPGVGGGEGKSETPTGRGREWDSSTEQGEGKKAPHGEGRKIETPRDADGKDKSDMKSHKG